MASIRYVKGQKTRWRNLLEEDLKKLDRIITDAQENEETKDDINIQNFTKKTIQRLNKNCINFKEFAYKLTNLIDETEESEIIEKREIEEEEEFQFLQQMDNILDEVKDYFGDLIEKNEEINRSTVNDKILTQITEAENRAQIFSDKLLERVSEMKMESRRQPEEISTRLPKLEMEKFDGNPLNYYTFWSQFEAVVDMNKRLTDVEKFNYLRVFLTGKALASIDGLMACSENYKEAISILKERFGRNSVIISELYSKLNKIPAPINKISSLRPFVDEVERLLRSLKALGKDIESDQLAHTIQSKLPKEVILEVSRNFGEEEWQMTRMWTYVKRYVNILEIGEKHSRIGSQPHDQNTSKSSTLKYRDPFATSTSQSTTGHSSAEALIATQHQPKTSPSRPCIFCSGVHWSDQCTTYRTIAERKAKIQGRCYKCFSSQHNARNCPKTNICFHCKTNANHHCSLCPKIFERSSKPAPRNQSSAVATITEKESQISNIASSGHFTMMQTTTTVVRNPKRPHLKFKLRVLFDSGSSRTFVSKSLAEKLQMQSETAETFNMSTFGSQHEITAECPQTEIELKLLDGSFHKVSTSVWPNYHLTKPMKRHQVQNEVIREILQYQLADEVPNQTEKGEVDMVIGNDYVNDFFLSGRIPVQSIEGLILLQSLFGWVLSGRMEREVLDDSEPISCLNFLSINYGNKIQHENVLFNSPESDRFLTEPKLDTNENQITGRVATVDAKKPMLNNSVWDRYVAMESIGIKDSIFESDDERAMEQFEETIKQENGRYQVRFPWKPDRLPPENYNLAVGRLRSLARRIERTQHIPLMENYNKILNEQQEKGIIEKVTPTTDEAKHKHYLPHHPVITPTKATTKVRLVYDASAKPYPKERYQSLNECLYSGPIHKLLQNLTALLISFRHYPVAVVSDIEKAFLQIGLQQPDRDMTRFLWFQDPSNPDMDNLDVYRFCRVPFGVKSSPFLLAAVLDHHLKSYNHPILRKLSLSLYVDNVTTGAWTSTETLQFYNMTKENLQDAKMNLREWRSNSEEFMNSIPEVDRVKSTKDKVLGVIWESRHDTLAIVSSIPASTDTPTKRRVSQIVASLFDPMGLFSPVRFNAIHFMQELWNTDISWDDPLPQNKIEQLKRIERMFEDITSYTFPRHIGPKVKENIKYSLVCFCDASRNAYATAVYLHITSTSDCKSELIFAKTRPTPKSMKKKPEATIPRLELMGILIGAKALRWLQEKLTEILQIEFQHIFLWSDSTIALSWIRSNKKLPVFIENRVKEIRATPNICFHHVATEENTADLATRTFDQTLTDFMKNSLWWHGPTWLSQSQDNWPKNDTFQIPMEQLSILAAGEDPEGEQHEYLIKIEDYSKLMRLLRVTAWILRAVKNWKILLTDKSKRRQNDKRRQIELEADEIIAARVFWEKSVQKHYFNVEIEAIRKKTRNRICQQLGLVIDPQGLLRCIGRFANLNLTEGARMPKLLPAQSHFTKLVIEQVHCDILHSGVSQTLATVRHSYWITKGRATVKKVLRSCRICRRSSGGSYQAPDFPPLPKEVSGLYPFSCTGLDYLGPLYIKTESEPKKVWICIFTCRTIRAIHLEIVKDMSTLQFLMALRRFFAKYGIPQKIISDNALQFKSAQEVLNMLYSDSQVHDFLSHKGVQWKFITPLAPWMGGFYERLVQCVKIPLKRCLGKKRITYVELSTVLTEVEAVLNDRPLTYIGEDINSTITLTPNRLLLAYNKVSLPTITPQKDDDESPDYVEKTTTTDKLGQIWFKNEERLSKFWDLFQQEYLLSLRERYQSSLKQNRIKAHEKPKVGTVVLIEDKLPRALWRIGQIKKLLRSQDGEIRSAEIRLPSGVILERSITQLCPLEVPVDDVPLPAEEDATAPPVAVPVTGRPQRQAAKEARDNIRQWIRAMILLKNNDLSSIE